MARLSSCLDIGLRDVTGGDQGVHACLGQFGAVVAEAVGEKRATDSIFAAEIMVIPRQSCDTAWVMSGMPAWAGPTRQKIVRQPIAKVALSFIEVLPPLQSNDEPDRTGRPAAAAVKIEQVIGEPGAVLQRLRPRTTCHGGLHGNSDKKGRLPSI